MIWPRPVALVNARVASLDGERPTIRFTRQVLAIGDRPRSGDHVIDMNGAWVLPGLVNAHDHLELNHYGPQHGRAPYANVQQWVDDMRTRLQNDPVIVSGRARSLCARLWAGGFKNLIAGVTTVAHHNPMYRGLQRATPVRVVERFGWAHSFAMEHQPVGAHGEPGGAVIDRFRATPVDTPFVLHIAEGVDSSARAELSTLDAGGALASNTVLVHGVAIDQNGWRLAAERGASAVWCPASNLALFGSTMDVREALSVMPGRVALGTDSRLSGARDLLDELCVASREARLTPDEQFSLVTSSPAAMLRLPAAGRLDAGVPADLVVLPASAASPGGALINSRRSDVQMVVLDGRPQLAVPEWSDVFGSRAVGSVQIRVDGRPRVADSRLLRAARRFGIHEPGVDLCH
jgi:cytosine/adenosine deaminase-related metal-dependent hydrolase